MTSVVVGSAMCMHIHTVVQRDGLGKPDWEPQPGDIVSLAMGYGEPLSVKGTVMYFT